MIELGIAAGVAIFLFLLWSQRWFRRSIRWTVTLAIVAVVLICCVGGAMLAAGSTALPA